jgi:hypothetical protein
MVKRRESLRVHLTLPGLPERGYISYMNGLMRIAVVVMILFSAGTTYGQPTPGPTDPTPKPRDPIQVPEKPLPDPSAPAPRPTPLPEPPLPGNPPPPDGPKDGPRN